MGLCSSMGYCEKSTRDACSKIILAREKSPSIIWCCTSSGMKQGKEEASASINPASRSFCDAASRMADSHWAFEVEAVSSLRRSRSVNSACRAVDSKTTSSSAARRACVSSPSREIFFGLSVILYGGREAFEDHLLLSGRVRGAFKDVALVRAEPRVEHIVESRKAGKSGWLPPASVDPGAGP